MITLDNSDDENNQDDYSVVRLTLMDFTSSDMPEQSYNNKFQLNGYQDEEEEEHNQEQLELSQQIEEYDENHDSLIPQDSVSSTSQFQHETEELADQKQKNDYLVNISQNIQTTEVAQCFTQQSRNETLIFMNQPEIQQTQTPQDDIIIKQEATKQRKNRTKNIPRIYGGYILKYWRKQMGPEWDSIENEIVKNIEDMKPKTLKDINFLRKYQTFRKESVQYLESNRLLFDFLESEKIQDIQPLIEVMNQYYLSFKHNKKLKNQTQGSQKRIKRD